MYRSYAMIKLQIIQLQTNELLGEYEKMNTDLLVVAELL